MGGHFLGALFALAIGMISYHQMKDRKDKMH